MAGPRASFGPVCVVVVGPIECDDDDYIGLCVRVVAEVVFGYVILYKGRWGTMYTYMCMFRVYSFKV